MDWFEAAAALEQRAGPDDAVQIWPPWAERARLFIAKPPLFVEEDLRDADYAGVQRLWLLALARAPHSRIERAREALLLRGATPLGTPAPFGALSLEAWDLHAESVLSDLLGGEQDHEVDYVPRRCLRAAIGTPAHPARIAARGEGGVLHLRAGLIGETAYDERRPSVRVQVLAGGVAIGELLVPPSVPPESGWRKAELAAPRGPHEFAFLISSADPARPFCLAAWTTAR